MPCERLQAIDGDPSGATADLDHALSIATDPEEIDAMKEIRTDLGL